MAGQEHRLGKEPHAMVLSGGGSFGAYGIGVMKSLFTGQCPSTGLTRISPTIFTGTSVGSLNASLLVADPDQDPALSLRSLEHLWFTELAGRRQSGRKELFRLRGDPTKLIKPQTLTRPFDTLLQYGEDAIYYSSDLLRRVGSFTALSEPWLQRSLYLASLSTLIDSSGFIELLQDVVDGRRISTSHKLLAIVATNWQSGKVMVFKNADFHTPDAHRYVAASAAVPGIFPPVAIAGQLFIDGGVLMNTPLKPAIDLGGETLHVIDLLPPVKELPVVTSELYVLQSTLAILERILVMAVESRLDQDISRIAWINLLLDKGPEAIEGKRRKLTIHRYHPSKPLGGSLELLNLEARQVESYIELGFEDAGRHDCQREGCVIPFAVPPPPKPAATEHPQVIGL